MKLNIKKLFKAKKIKTQVVQDNKLISPDELLKMSRDADKEYKEGKLTSSKSHH